MIFCTLEPLDFKWVGLQYHKSIPTLIQCQESLCLKFRRIRQLQFKLSHGNHSDNNNDNDRKNCGPTKTLS